MKPARYIGWRQDLKGKTALMRPAVHRGKNGEERVMIQMDNLLLDDGVTENPLAYGWHDFAADQWQELTEEE